MSTASLFDRAYTDVSRDARLSDCLLYRWELRRWWDDEKPFALLWMLNPSNADAAIDDPTIVRGISFARRENCGGLIVVNWNAYRATGYKIQAQQPGHVHSAAFVAPVG
jgi:hypothetical protein